MLYKHLSKRKHEAEQIVNPSHSDVQSQEIISIVSFIGLERLSWRNKELSSGDKKIMNEIHLGFGAVMLP